MKNQTADVVVIGGGAAGMLTAGFAASQGRSVVLLEKNTILGKKLRITGKGRCNLTNNCSVSEFLDNLTKNKSFMYGAANRFTPEDAARLFEGLGVPLKTERGGRVFPVSDKAADVVSTLERYLAETGAQVVRGEAKRIITSDGKVGAVLTKAGVIRCESAVICTGGLSYPGTGSTGGGFAMAAELGHTIVTPVPSLVPLESDEVLCAELQGFTLKNVRLTARDSAGRALYSELGDMLFTHFGVSGPLVLSASAHMRDFENEKYTLHIDLKPGLDEKKLTARILRDFAENPNRDFTNVMGGLAGRSMIPVLVRLSGIPGDTKAHSITRRQRAKLIRLLKDFTVSVKGPRPVSEAIVTSGGVDVREVEPKTMRSKLTDGLYFAGEVLDVDAYTGGYNLQIAWSTAYAAGMAV